MLLALGFPLLLLLLAIVMARIEQRLFPAQPIEERLITSEVLVVDTSRRVPESDPERPTAVVYPQAIEHPEVGLSEPAQLAGR